MRSRRSIGVEPGPLVLAFVLGEIMERAFRQSMLLSGGSLDIFVTRPLSGGLLVVMALIIVLSVVAARRRRAVFGHMAPEELDADAEQPAEGDAAAGSRFVDAGRGVSTSPSNEGER